MADSRDHLLGGALRGRRKGQDELTCYNWTRGWLKARPDIIMVGLTTHSLHDNENTVMKKKNKANTE